ncbi:MAG: porin family protein [Acidobacteriia bacterium]|nr:porin family protein [Terriglobia bacterium]
MKKLIATLALLLMAPAWVSAQGADPRYRGQEYIFIGEGSFRSSDGGLHGITHVGGGGEVLLVKGFGVGAELGAMGRPGYGVGVFSMDPSYHFRRASSKTKLSPFVEGGYTRTFGQSDFPDIHFNFGGGIHYWAFKRVGLRLEFRDHVHHVSPIFASGHTYHYWGLRIGLAFR